MRNLKKFLALVMAMVMAFSLMLTVNAANPVKTFDDADQITEQFVEAADVLTGMKVFQGDERGFAPSATITRAEVAALIYRLATGDVDDVRAGLYANYGNFTDVNEGDWYAGYVGYCANAGYIKGTSPTTFNPYGKVTGYEVLAMILRAIGYDKNNEFVGATWQTNVSALATQLHILENIKTTDYGNTLHLASRRDVVADLLFQAVAYVPMVTYTLAFGYQDTGMTGGVTGYVKNPTLGYYIFGLWNNRYDNKDEFGVVLGNQETGENGTVIGYSGTSGDTATTIYGEAKVKPVDFSKYTYQQAYYKTDLVGADTGTAVSGNITLGYNLKFDLGTGVDLVGHQVDIWYNQKNLTSKGYETYAYFDEVVLAEVVKVAHGTHAVGDETAITNMRTEVAQNVTLYSAMKAAGFSVNKTTTSAYLNNSYGKFSLTKWSDFDSANDIQYSTASINSTTNAISNQVDVKSEESPEHLYMVVSNSSSKAPDAVISLNIQTSNLTGVDNVNTIKTVTVPFAYDTNKVVVGNSDWRFIAADNVLTSAADNTTTKVAGGTLEQKQLVGNSAKTLGAKEIGLHITGTKAYTPERTGNNAVTGTANYDTNWFKLTPVTQTKDGVVVAYNNSTVTLSDGTVLEKSIVYDTVVPGTIPQVGLDSYNNDLYEHTNYRFYLNDAGKFVGAERIHGSEFVYGTYVDYSQELNSSAFKYFLTGVKLDGTTTTVPVTSLGWSNTQRPVDITSTSRLGVPFRDGGNYDNNTQGIGTGVYRGFSYGSDIANWTFAGLNDIGVVAGANNTSTTGTSPVVVDAGTEVTTNTAPVTNVGMPIVVFDGYAGSDNAAFPSSEDRPSTANNTANDSIIIGSREVALGATYAGTLDMDGSAAGTADLLYFTENTKFILVSGYGTDSLKTEVYDGISELRGSSSQVQINLQYVVNNAAGVVASQGALNTGNVNLANVPNNVKMSDMTYFTQSPFIYAQNQVLSRQADVIILPAVAVTRTNASNIRYVGNATPTMTNSNAVLGNTATRFTMYNDGVAEQVWIDGLVDFTQGTNTNDGDTTRNSATLVAYGNSGAINSGSPRYHDHFWNLIDTGRTANDGQPIYRVTPVYVGTGLVDASQATAQNTYVASTYSAQTGSFTTNATITGTAAVTRMLNVSSATITNLNADNPNPTWPGINDLATLNEAGSLGIYQSPQYGGTQQLKVSFLLAGNSGTNQLTVTQIYVCYEQ